LTLELSQELRVQDGGDVGYLAPEYKAMLDQASPAGAAALPPGDEDGAGAGAGGKPPGAGGGGDGARELAAAEEAVRQLFRDHLRLGGGAGGGARGRLQGLDEMLKRAGDAGARLPDVVAYMRGGGQ
jgi:hypothetical protein